MKFSVISIDRNNMKITMTILLLLIIIQFAAIFIYDDQNKEGLYDSDIKDIIILIVKSDLWQGKKDVIDQQELIGVDLSIVKLNNSIINYNEMKFDSINNILYHNLNLKSYTNNNIYGITIEYKNDSASVIYGFGKHHAGMFAAYKKNDKWYESEHILLKR